METKQFVLTMEVSGCPVSCRHCWARGGYYEAMPLARAAQVLEQAQEFLLKE